MDFLQFLSSAEVASIHSSKDFADAMIYGLIDGLNAKGYSVRSETELLVKRKAMTFYQFTIVQSRKIGDIDIVLKFTEEKQLENILPSSGHIIRPEVAKLWMFNSVLIEVKRSCFGKHIDQKIKQFCKFYRQILNPTFLRNIDNYEFSKQFDVDFQNMLVDQTVPIVFLYNGSDCVSVYNKMLVEIPDGMIHGHPVCVIFCKSDELTKWSFQIESENRLTQQEQEKNQIILEKDQVISELRRQLAEKK